jgi:hypothetical protein
MSNKKTYFEMAKEAIGALKERTGSSAQAIKTYIASKYPAVKFQQVTILLSASYSNRLENLSILLSLLLNSTCSALP